VLLAWRLSRGPIEAVEGAYFLFQVSPGKYLERRLGDKVPLVWHKCLHVRKGGVNGFPLDGTRECKRKRTTQLGSNCHLIHFQTWPSSMKESFLWSRRVYCSWKSWDSSCLVCNHLRWPTKRSRLGWPEGAYVPRRWLARQPWGKSGLEGWHLVWCGPQNYRLAWFLEASRAFLCVPCPVFLLDDGLNIAKIIGL